MVGAAFFWGSGFILIKLTGGEIPPLVLSTFRGGIAALALAAWFLAQGRSIRPEPGEARVWAVIGTLNGWAPNALTAYALMLIPAALASMVQASGPLVVAVLASLMFAEERLTARRIAGVLIGFSGMAVLFGPAAFGTGGIALAGLLAMIAVTLLYASGTLYVRHLGRGDPARLALGQQIVSGGAALPLALVVDGPAAFAIDPAHLPVLIGLGVVATALPIFLFMRLIRAAGPTRASMVGYLLPVFTTVLAIVLIGERVSYREIAGGAVILAGVWLVTAPARKRAA
jgi:drug/metabolite transporter (DMT)-like permease